MQAAEPATNEPLPTAETVLKSLIESGPKETEAGEQFEEHRDDVVKVR